MYINELYKENKSIVSSYYYGIHLSKLFLKLKRILLLVASLVIFLKVFPVLNYLSRTVFYDVLFQGSVHKSAKIIPNA